jgi:hypothetical protein
VRAAVDAILDYHKRSDAGIKCWGDVVAADSKPYDQIKPDLVFTRLRDAQPSLRASVFFIENKLIGNLDYGISQCATYLRRQMRVLIEEWDTRYCEGSGHSVLPHVDKLVHLRTFGACCDGASISFVRVSSGVPEGCDSLASIIPMAEVCSDGVPFVPIDGTYKGGPVPLAEVPTPGFAALFHLLRFSPDVLSPESAPLTAIKIAGEKEVTLSDRLGCGGSSDVYSGHVADDGGRLDVVVKVARFATASVTQQFDAESKCLDDLEGGPFPTVFECTTFGSSPAGSRDCSRPVLVFRGPLNATPLLLRVRSMDVSLSEREAFADRVASCLLEAVQVRFVFCLA